MLVHVRRATWAGSLCPAPSSWRAPSAWTGWEKKTSKPLQRQWGSQGSLWHWDKTDEAPSLATTKPPSPYLQPSLFSFSDPLSYPLTCHVFPSHPIQILTHAHLTPVAYRGVTEAFTPRSHSLVPGLTRTCLPILVRDCKFHSKVKSKLTYRLPLCSYVLVVVVLKC
jgi:hypothetical protein